jgi:hypothetical protein
MDISNRTIWTLWYQGYDRAPPIGRAALESWRREAAAGFGRELGNVQKLDWRIDAESPHWAAALASLAAFPSRNLEPAGPSE